MAAKIEVAGDEVAGEKTTKQISRQTIHRRLRRLGRKLDDIRVMFNDVADAARIGDNHASKLHQSDTSKGRSRTGQNARRSLRGQDGRFVAVPGQEGVKDLHPSPKQNQSSL